MSGCDRFQKGVAVITVLLALAIAALISSEVIMRVYAGMKRSENQMNAQQAREYALGGEAWARQRLAVDYEKDKQRQVDHFREEWAMPAQTLDIDGGFIEIEIYDMQSRFNLNNMVDDKGQIIQEKVSILARLLSRLGANASYAELAARWASYADDTNNVYGSKELPYRAGDTQFGSVSELRLLLDMDLIHYRKAAPFLSALPVADVPININTAPEAVLAALVKADPGDRLRAFIQQREQQEEGFQSSEMFINQVIGNGEGVKKEDLSVSSDYFEVRVRTEYNGKRAHLISTLYRDSETGEIILLSRDHSQRFSFISSRISDRKKSHASEDKDDDKDEDDSQASKKK